MDFGFGRVVAFTLPFGADARGFPPLTAFAVLRTAGFAFAGLALLFIFFVFAFAIEYLDSR